MTVATIVRWRCPPESVIDEPVLDVGDAHLLEGVLRARESDLAREPAGPQVGVDLLARREVEERLAFLWHDGDERSDLVGLLIRSRARRSRCGPRSDGGACSRS